MKALKIFTSAILLLILGNAQAAGQKKISLAELEDKIAGAWIGQMVGNFYGLPFENKFVDEPGPENWPYGYTKNIDKLRDTGGAFSDDDTDIEYMYLIQMEKHGIEPTYEQMRQAWMYHIRDRVWLANRAALGLMHYGLTPPFTGMMEMNPHWYQIDPQLVNEIWAYTAPGMVDYVAAKSDWAARITSDGWAVSPTVHYGAMYAAAFFEKDIRKLVLGTLNVLPADDRYAETVRHMVRLYDEYPNDWKKARAEMADAYYHNEPEMTRTIWNANLNGACAILSLLYGKGDFQLTMDLGVAIGFDCDNQTASMGGLLGVMYGASAIPAHLTMPVEGWTTPFNDRYINVTRHDLPDADISDMIKRTVDQAVKVATTYGGKLTGKPGSEVLHINTKAKFNAPLEFGISPMPVLEVGIYTSYPFSNPTNSKYDWRLASGTLPEGMTFSGGILEGTPKAVGKYDIVLSLSDGKKTIEQPFTLIVRGRNIAREADAVLANVSHLNEAVLDSCWITYGKPLYATDVEVIRDGKTGGTYSVFNSIAAKANIPKIDYFGYEWSGKRTIDMLSLAMGAMEEFGGWFSSLSVQYRDENGRWTEVSGFRTYPDLPETDIVFFQPHFVEYLMEFDPVETDAIRVILDAAVQTHWHAYTKHVSSFISITELSVYEKQ